MSMHVDTHADPDAQHHAARTQARIDRLLAELREELGGLDDEAARGVYESAAQTLEALSRQFQRLAEGGASEGR